MNFKFQSFCAVFCCTILCGCATLSEDECRMGNWYEIGRRDGAFGRPASRLNKHHEACSKYQLAPNQERYYRGREVGLLSYCVPENGLREGLDGKAYHHVCPPHLESPFLKNYHRGYKMYEIKTSLKRVESDIEDRARELEKPDLTSEKKATLKHKIHALEEEKFQLRTALTAMEVIDFVKSYSAYDKKYITR